MIICISVMIYRIVNVGSWTYFFIEVKQQLAINLFRMTKMKFIQEKSTYSIHLINYIKQIFKNKLCNFMSQEEQLDEHDQELFDQQQYQYRDGEEEESQYQQEGQQEEDQHFVDHFRDQSLQQQSPKLSHRNRDASEELNLSFQRDISSLTKVKATIIYNINQQRQKNGLTQMYQDITLTSIAMQYASSLKDNQGDKNYYLEKYKDLDRNDVDFKTSYIKSEYQKDAQITKQFTINYFIEMGYLFFQIDQDRKILLDQNYNHIGLGLAGNADHIIVVLLMAQRDIAITQIIDKGENNVQVKGKMLDHTIGICGVKVYNTESFDKIKKQGEKQEPESICSVLFDQIDFNRATKEFCVYLSLKQNNWKQRRWIQLLTRENPDAIPYRKPRKQKDKDKNLFKHLKPKLRALFIEYPDKQFMMYYQQLAELKKKKKQDLLYDIQREEEEKLRLQQQLRNKQLNQQVVEQEESQKQGSQQQSQLQQPVKEQNKEGTVSNKQIRQQLQQAITQAKSTYQTLLLQNKQLQQKIKELKSKNQSTYVDKTGEMSMNQHKYLNTLTQVHQTRVDLQTTQDRYNRMSIQLQNKLNQKQAKCNQIRVAFQQLKRQVAKKAAYSRSDMPIKAHKIDDWEQRQKKLAQELQTLRLQILRARNTLSKNQKILKKKEQLAEGLHLIDFQQLKIQNQTLNQKIQQRNEDLHKLKKKTTTIVQILTHTREKLGYVTAFKNQLQNKSNQLDQAIKALRNSISKKKDECDQLKINIQEAKQQTQIVNSQQLVVDFKKRAQHIEQLEQQIKQLQGQQKQMKTVIQNYQRKMRKEVIKK